ncbi:hypothetical protein [Parasphingorhabdus pacifica]
MNYNEQAAQLAGAKSEHAWLKQAPSHVLQQTLMEPVATSGLPGL